MTQDSSKKYQISFQCFRCGACTGVCPIHCIEHIHLDTYRINQEKCTQCGLCTTVCPADAIHKVSVHS